MYKLIIGALLLTIFVQDLQTREVLPTAFDFCYGTNCPNGTVLCKKQTKTSTDRKTLNINVRCIGDAGELLYENKTEKENPYEGVQINSIAVHGVFKLPGFNFGGLGGDGNFTRFLTPAPDTEVVDVKENENVETLD